MKVSRTPLIVKGSKPKTILGVAPTREHVDEALNRRKRKNDGAVKGENEGITYGSFRQNLCGNGTETGTGTDIMPKYRTHLSSQIRCSVKV